MEPERMTSLDASFWYLERPSMHMHVAATSVFEPRADGPLTFQDVRRVLRSRIHLAPRLRQRVLAVPFNLARPVWVDDDRFDLDLHLHHEALPAPGGRAELEDAVGRALSIPLDRSRPLWEIHVLEGLSGSRTAVLLKLHHAMADGIGGMLVASVLFDLEPGAPIAPDATAEPWRPLPLPSAQELLFEAAREALSHPVGALGRAVDAPSRAVAEVAEVIGGARTLVGLGKPPAGPFDVMVKPARRFAIAEAPFEVVRKAKSGLGATVNDVVLAVVASGLHELLESRGQTTRGRSLRVMVPVSVRTGAQQGDVGNRVAPAFLDVPVGTMRSRTRLQRIARATAELKASSMAVGADSIIGLGALAPAAIHAMAARVVSRTRWFNLVVSNVPAPQIPLYMAGARLLATYPGMPLAENCGLSIACTSLGGTLAFGLTADWDSLPDLDVLARAIESSITDLAQLAG